MHFTGLAANSTATYLEKPSYGYELHRVWCLVHRNRKRNFVTLRYYRMLTFWLGGVINVIKLLMEVYSAASFDDERHAGLQSAQILVSENHYQVRR